MRASLMGLALFCVSQIAFAGHHETSEVKTNAEKAEQFFLSFLSGDLTVAKALAHDDFTFVAKGRTRISNLVQTKEMFFTEWVALVGNLIPAGFTKFEFTKSVSENDSVVWFAEGDGEGVNGRYNNEYVFAFEFVDGKIMSIVEYNSDLLVATRLYEQKLVADD